MKFAFNCRVTVECPVEVEAETEAEAWSKALEGDVEIALQEFSPLRKPIYTRAKERDDYGL